MVLGDFMSGRFVPKAFEKTCYELHSNHLFLFLRIRYTLVILATFKGKLLLVAFFLLANKMINKFLSFHFFTRIKVYLFFTVLLADRGEKAAYGLASADVKP